MRNLTMPIFNTHDPHSTVPFLAPGVHRMACKAAQSDEASSDSDGSSDDADSSSNIDLVAASKSKSSSAACC